MTKLEKIEQDIASLSKADLAKLSDWLEDYKADLWDQQIAADAKAGKLDKLFEEAEADIAAGKVRPQASVIALQLPLPQSLVSAHRPRTPGARTGARHGFYLGLDWPA